MLFLLKSQPFFNLFFLSKYNRYSSLLLCHKSSVKEHPHQRGKNFRHRKSKPEIIKSQTGKQISKRYKQNHRAHDGKKRTFDCCTNRLKKYWKNQGSNHRDKTDSDKMKSDCADCNHLRSTRKYTEHLSGNQIKNQRSDEHHPHSSHK